MQGVGFRYTVQRLADGFDVSGYVKNLPDGRVELVVEGKPAETAAMLSRIDAALGHYIREAKTDVGTAGREFDGFTIRF